MVVLWMMKEWKKKMMNNTISVDKEKQINDAFEFYKLKYNSMPFKIIVDETTNKWSFDKTKETSKELALIFALFYDHSFNMNKLFENFDTIGRINNVFEK